MTAASTARVIRDIRWAVGSAPLLLPADDAKFPKPDWFLSQLADLEPALQMLAADHSALETLNQHSRQLRLGGYFEQLILWWLNHSTRYQVLAHNLQVNDQGRTLGAFDLIVHDKQDQLNEHWELACKFYLQDGDSGLIQSWFGPARKDKLEKKLQHLLNHQIALSQHPSGSDFLKRQGWPISRHRILVKGRLFGNAETLPDVVNPDCLVGWLKRRRDYQPSDGDLPLQRQHWMSEVEDGDIEQPNAATASRHGCLCIAQVAHGMETSRGFVVPDDWATAV
jgi:hypothetical protein